MRMISLLKCLDNVTFIVWMKIKIDLILK